jgi:hypothetical protein
LEPDESGICHLYKYAPDESPFRFLTPVRRLLRVIDPWGAVGIGRGVIKRIGRAVCRRSGHRAAADVLSTSRIPLHLLSSFAPAECKYTDDIGSLNAHPTLFDHLRKHGKTWTWVGYPRHFGSFESIAKTFQSSPKNDVTYLHFSELDWLGHKFGPDSEEVTRAITSLDDGIRTLLAPHLTSESRVVVFGDHGMARVTYRIDMMTVLKAVPFVLGTDYVTFLDSTQARFWFHSSDARTAIEKALRETHGGHILSTDERRALGETIFAVDGPGLIHPSFFDHTASGPKGMHGYLPAVEENQTQIFLYPSEPRDRGTIRMTEMFGLMRDHLLP